MKARERTQSPTNDPITQPPRYRAVTDALRLEMDEGRLAPGVRLPTLHQLADRYSVSTHTVRCAIRLLEREGRIYHVPAVGSFVGRDPRGTHTVRQQTTVVLITLDIGGSLEMGFARGIEQACQQRGWALQVLDSRMDIEIEDRNLARLPDLHVQGAIIVPTGSHDNIESLFRLKLAGFPMVLLDRTIPGLKVDIVESDHEGGAWLATKYLLDLGHQPVRMLTEWPRGTSSIQGRINGYERALREHGINPDPDWLIYIDPDISARGVKQDRYWLGPYEAVLPVLKQLKTPLAFFALNDYLCWGLYQACRELNLSIPDDVSVVAFDNSAITRAMIPAATTIAQRCQEIGERAVELLARRLQPERAGDPAEHVVLDVDLIEGGSATPPRAS